MRVVNDIIHDIRLFTIPKEERPNQESIYELSDINDNVCVTCGKKVKKIESGLTIPIIWGQYENKIFFPYCKKCLNEGRNEFFKEIVDDALIANTKEINGNSWAKYQMIKTISNLFIELMKSDKARIRASKEVRDFIAKFLK